MMGFVLVGVALAVLVVWLTVGPARRSASSEPDEPRVSATPPDPYPEHPDAVLETRLGAIASRAPGHCGIVAKDLRTGAVARANADERIPLMSVVKLPVAVVVLEGVDQGCWPMSTPITLAPLDMHPRGWLGDRYPRGGGPVALGRPLDLMLRFSDNSAADALLRLAGGGQAVTGWLERHDIRDLRVDRSERELGNDWYGLAPGADTLGSAEGIRELRAQVPEAVHDSAAQAMLLDPRDTGSAAACVRLLERLWRERPARAEHREGSPWRSTMSGSYASPMAMTWPSPFSSEERTEGWIDPNG